MKRCGAAAGLILALVSVSAGSAARDAFPGRNGRIAFMSVRANGGVELYGVNADGTGITQLTAHAPRTFRPPAWSPDGRSIAIDDANLDQDRVVVVDLRTQRVRPLSSPIYAVAGISWSPDGRRFVYSGRTAGNSGLWIARRDGGGQRRLTPHHSSDSSPAWSPDGTRIAFTRGHWSESEDRMVGEVAIIRADGRGLRRLGRGESPSWSPDGKQLVIHVPERSSLAVQSADGRSRRSLLDVRRGCVLGGPAWSQTGVIAFAVRCGDGVSEMRAIRADGTRRRTLIKRLPAYAPTPTWSPNGSTLAFADGTGTLWVANRGGSRLRRFFTASPGADYRPAWSPDGRRLAAAFWTRPPRRTAPELVDSTVGSPSWSPDGGRLVGIRGEGADRIVVVDLESGEQHEIYQDEGIGYPTLSDPAWSPDGRSIAFGTENGSIVFYDVAGEELVWPKGGIEGGDPAWSPDGQRLAFSTSSDSWQPTRLSSIFTALADGSQRRLVASNASQPAWSPDGQKIVFVRDVSRGNTELFVMDADGTHQRRLTFNAGPDLAPDWQPVPR